MKIVLILLVTVYITYQERSILNGISEIKRLLYKGIFSWLFLLDELMSTYDLKDHYLVMSNVKRNFLC